MTSQAKEPTPSVADLRPGGADLGGLWQIYSKEGSTGSIGYSLESHKMGCGAC